MATKFSELDPADPLVGTEIVAVSQLDTGVLKSKKATVSDIAALAGGGSADEVTYDNSTSGLTATDVQDAIDEIKSEVDSIPSGGGASSADQVSYDNSTSGLTATDVQDAIDELQGDKVSKSGDTIADVTLVGYTETVAAGGTSLDPSSGTIQTYTMSSNTTFTDSLSDGQNLTLHLSGGDTYAATWPTITWVGGSSPALSAADVLQFWKVGGVLFGAYVGSIA